MNTIYLLTYFCRWAILCLGWHCNVRRQNLDTIESSAFDTAFLNAKSTGNSSLRNSVVVTGGKTVCPHQDITRHNLARFLGWGLPAFQTAAVIIARLVDADELIGKNKIYCSKISINLFNFNRSLLCG